VWSTEEPCTVEVLTREDVLDKLVYIATNPVKDGLVEKVHHWPGPRFLNALVGGRSMRATRPRHFFREDGPMPAEIELELGLPDHFEDKVSFLAELERQVLEVEARCAEARAASGRRVVGRRSILRQYWGDSPASREPRRGLRPRLASRNKWLRVATLQRNKAWTAEYRDARARWMRGEDVTFPYGTYWLRRFSAIKVEPAPAER
jgi:hypothetical protein